MTDFIIEMGELVEKWFPELEWDDIMNIVTSDNPVSRRAEEIIRRRRGYDE